MMQQVIHVGENIPTEATQFISSVTSPTGVATYEALEPRGKRRSVTRSIQPEDLLLNESRRDRLASNAMDLHRNATLFAWAVRRHLDYNTHFDFQPNTGDDSLDADLRALMKRDNRPENCDIGGRHSWERLRRLMEVRKILDGDAGLLKLRSGHLQGIESNQIRTPRQKREDADRWRNGVKLGTGNRAVAYAITDMLPNGEAKERVVRASQLMLLACFEGRFSQVRGISPVAGALNEFRDIYEIKDLMQAKVKLDQIFGVAFTRGDESGDVADDFDDAEADDDPQTDRNHERKKAYEIGQNVKAFDLDVDEGVELIQSNNPSRNTQQFLALAIQIGLKALDLPFNFFDEAHTNFYGSRAAGLEYERTCLAKREDQLALHREYTMWRLWRWMLPVAAGGTGELVLPRSMTVESLPWRWVHLGRPWWKPTEELAADIQAAAMGLKPFQQICDERGFGNWNDNVRQIGRELAQAAKDGAQLVFNNAKLAGALTFEGTDDED